MQNVVTAVIAGRVRRRQRKRGKRQKQRKRHRKRRKRRYLRGEWVVQISTGEYRHMAMMDKTRDWHENLKLRERDYAVVIDAYCLSARHTGTTICTASASFGNILGFYRSSPRNTPSCDTGFSRTA